MAGEGGAVSANEEPVGLGTDGAAETKVNGSAVAIGGLSCKLRLSRTQRAIGTVIAKVMTPANKESPNACIQLTVRDAVADAGTDELTAALPTFSLVVEL